MAQQPGGQVTREDIRKLAEELTSLGYYAYPQSSSDGFGQAMEKVEAALRRVAREEYAAGLLAGYSGDPLRALDSDNEAARRWPE